jgi:hypothetical protein
VACCRPSQPNGATLPASAGAKPDHRRCSRERFSVGDEVRVFAARVDTFKRQVDFALADEIKRKR